MKIENYKHFCAFEYTSKKSTLYELGDVVINTNREIGIIIQIHGGHEFRTDMFGNCSSTEIRLATEKEFKEYRPSLYKFWLQEQEPITDVVFRKYKDGDIIALFVNEPYHANSDDDTISSYIHVGQHGAASYKGVMKDTKAATKKEYEELCRELMWIGYRLNIKSKR